MTTFGWDELSNEIWTIEDPAQQRAIDTEVGFEYQRTLDNGVRIYSTDRHFGLEVEAIDAKHAHDKFMVFGTYAEYQKED